VRKSKEDRAGPNTHCLARSGFNCLKNLGEPTLTDISHSLHAKLHEEAELRNAIKRVNRGTLYWKFDRFQIIWRRHKIGLNCVPKSII
jgi:hypothetical protein